MSIEFFICAISSILYEKNVYAIHIMFVFNDTRAIITHLLESTESCYCYFDIGLGWYGYHTLSLKFFLCDGQGTVRPAIL